MEVYDVSEESIIDEEPVIQEVKAVAVEPNEEPKEGFFTKLWNKTIFPEMIKNKREEKALMREVKRQARLEAILEPAMKKAMIQKEKDRISGKKKKDFLEKLAKGFGAGEDGKGLDTTAKLNQMLGSNSSSKQFDISSMIGQNTNKKSTPINTKRKEVDVLSMMGTGQDNDGMFDIGRALGIDKKQEKKPKRKTNKKPKKKK